MERGRPRTISSEVREHICLIARTSPADWRFTAFSTWSLTKPAEHLVKQSVVPAVGRETLWRILREGKVSWQSTTTWKSRTTRTSSPRCTGYWRCTARRRPMAGWCAWTSSGR
ncbi:hypothetical protein ACUN29_38550 [Streptomyces sp. WC2508]|uniref:hypothetical protein n=1 Tax=unclassified Streptomyces TaxID=2593676 RepID=UPI00386DF88A